jgi:hypothetical protein
MPLQLTLFLGRFTNATIQLALALETTDHTAPIRRINPLVNGQDAIPK